MARWPARSPALRPATRSVPAGKDIARIVGGIGGAVAGHEAGKRAFTEGYYAVSVDMKNGGTKRINVPDSGGLQVGQKVRVNNDTITPR